MDIPLLLAVTLSTKQKFWYLVTTLAIFYIVLFIVTIMTERKTCNQIWLWTSLAVAVISVLFWVNN